MRWRKVVIDVGAGPREAVAPEVLSASRATDIPAFHGEWFMEALRRGHCVWTNPFGGREQFVSFHRAKAIVFWSKNPAPFLRHLPELDRRGIRYYFQYTLNDYEAEGFEPNLPPLRERVTTFMELSRRLGRDSVIWRFDPLVLADGLALDGLIRKIKDIGDILFKYTSKLVFSFVDVARYRKVQNALRRAGLAFREWDESDMAVAAERIAALCEGWGIVPATCGERCDLSRFGIRKNRCVDDALLLGITGCDADLARLYGRAEQRTLFPGERPAPRDPGQRSECRCVPSKDIGMYDTCPHFCVYCYANTSPEAVRRNLRRLGLSGGR